MRRTILFLCLAGLVGCGSNSSSTGGGSASGGSSAASGGAQTITTQAPGSQSLPGSAPGGSSAAPIPTPSQGPQPSPLLVPTPLPAPVVSATPIQRSGGAAVLVKLQPGANLQVPAELIGPDLYRVEASDAARVPEVVYLEPDAGGLSQAVLAIEQAIAEHDPVLDCDWSTDFASQALHEAVDRARQHDMAVVAAAGGFPADWRGDGLLSVSTGNPLPGVDLEAPGGAGEVSRVLAQLRSLHPELDAGAACRRLRLAADPTPTGWLLNPQRALW